MPSTTTIPCACCGGGCDSHKKCFQLWTARWDCDSQAWTLTPGGKFCLPEATATGWTLTSADAFGCSYQAYVPTGLCCEGMMGMAPLSIALA